MKRTFVSALLYAFMFSAYALSLSSSSVLSLEAKDFSLEAGPDAFSFRSSHLSYGEGSGGGILHALDSPYRSTVLTPYVSLPLVHRGVDMVVLENDGFSVFSFTGRRSGIGTSLVDGKFSLLWVYVGKGKPSPVQKEYLLREEETLYLGFKYDSEPLKAEFLSSVTEDFVFSSFFSLSISFGKIGVSGSKGAIQTLFSSSSGYRSSLFLQISEDSFSWEGGARVGRNPVYSYEYRTLEWEEKARLNLFGAVFSTRIERTFSKGKEKVKREGALSWKEYTIGYDGKDFFLEAGWKDVKVHLSPSSPWARLEVSGRSNACTWSIELSTREGTRFGMCLFM